MYWRIAIIPDGIRAQICFGKNPDLTFQKISYIKNIATIIYLFTECTDYDELLNYRLPQKLEDKINNQSKEIAKKDGATGIMEYDLYKMAVHTESNYIEILADIPNVNSQEDFGRKIGSSIDSAIKALGYATQVYTTQDPAKAVSKWYKILKANKYE